MEGGEAEGGEGLRRGPRCSMRPLRAFHALLFAFQDETEFSPCGLVARTGRTRLRWSSVDLGRLQCRSRMK